MALTLPTLIQNHNKQVVETRLKRFYSSINQAIQLAELDYGQREDWFNYSNVDTDKNGNAISGKSSQTKWVKKYLVPYMKVVKIEEVDNLPIIYFADGSSLATTHWATLNDWAFFPGKCVKERTYANIAIHCGKCAFFFNYHPIKDSDKNWNNIGKSFEPYKYGWDGTLEQLEDSCFISNNGCCKCAALIQYHGWKIPKNYKIKVNYR